MQHYLFPLLAAAALAGCGSQFPLRPDNGKTTTVSLHNTTPQAQFMSLGLEDDYDCYQRRPGVALGQNHRVLQLSAKANQSFFFSYMGFEGMNVTTCTGVITIPTKEGHDYRVNFSRMGDGCTVEAYERQTLTVAETKIPVIKRNYAQPLVDSSGPWCAADSRFLGSSNLATPRTADK